jgi:hypothetical protein
MHTVLKQYFLCKNITKIQAAAAVPLPQFQLPTGSDKKNNRNHYGKEI